MFIAQTITDADYADDIVRPADAPTRAESLLHNLEQASTESDTDMRLANAWTAIDRFSIIWKSDLSVKLKCIFSKQRSSQFSYLNAD